MLHTSSVIVLVLPVCYSLHTTVNGDDLVLFAGLYATYIHCNWCLQAFRVAKCYVGLQWCLQAFLLFAGLFGVCRPFWCLQAFLVFAGLFGVCRPFWCLQAFLVFAGLFGVCRPFWCSLFKKVISWQLFLLLQVIQENLEKILKISI